MIGGAQLASIFLFGLVISGIVGMGVMRAKEFQSSNPASRQSDDRP